MTYQALKETLHPCNTNACATYYTPAKKVCASTFQIMLHPCTNSQRSALHVSGMYAQKQFWPVKSIYQPFSLILGLPVPSVRSCLLQQLPLSQLFLIVSSKPASCISPNATTVSRGNKRVPSQNIKTISAIAAANILWQSPRYQCRYPAPSLSPRKAYTQGPSSISQSSAQVSVTHSFLNCHSTH